MTNVLALPTGTGLVGDFKIERMLGAGGFGITYLAHETALDRRVTIKEYFPTELAVRGENLVALPRDAEAKVDFEWGLVRFIDEAQTLARFDHRNIVKVYRYFRANDTAYMVLHFEEGHSLKGWLKSLGRQPRQRELDVVIEPLLAALEVIHAADFLHRDIAPDNIIIRKDGSPVLIDFGSARGDIATRSRTVSALVKPGYSPYEQYAENGQRQGPWTDIYALGATLYHVVCGRRPPDAPSRMVKDELVPARDAAQGAYRASFLNAIDRALTLEPERRPQSIPAWRGDLLAPEPAKPGWLGKSVLRPPAEELPAGKTRVLTRQPGAAPLPPDVPAAKGALLDYVDGLKQQATPAAPSAATVPVEPPPRPAPAAEPAADSGPKKSGSKPKSKAAPKPAREQLPVVVPSPPKPARPRPVRWGGTSWRSFAFKLLIGVGIAGAAVAMQDRLPHVDVGTTSLVTGSVRDTALRLPVISGHRGGTLATAFTEDGRALVTAGADGTVKVWNVTTGAQIRSIELGDGPLTSLALHGRRAVSGHQDGSIGLIDVESGTRIGRFKRNDATVWSVAFAGGPKRFIAAGHDWTAAVWDATVAEAPVGVLEGHASAVQAVAYSPNGPYIATGSADRTVRLWRDGNLNPVRTYRGHKEYVTALAFSPDGRYLASGALDGSIRVWHTSSNSLYRVQSGHQARIAGLAFSPNGDMIASADEDGAVRVWSFRQSRAVRTLVEQGHAAKAVAFAPDSRRLAVASADGPVRLLDAGAAPSRR